MHDNKKPSELQLAFGGYLHCKAFADQSPDDASLVAACDAALDDIVDVVVPSRKQFVEKLEFLFRVECQNLDVLPVEGARLIESIANYMAPEIGEASFSRRLRRRERAR